MGLFVLAFPLLHPPRDFGSFLRILLFEFLKTSVARLYFAGLAARLVPRFFVAFASNSMI